MNLCFTPFLSVHRWLVGKSVVFALLGLLALDGGLCVTSALAQSTTGFSISPSTMAYSGTVGGPNQVLGVTITNTGASTVTVTWTDPINWLVATSGDTVTIAPGKSGMISHTASTAGLNVGTYSGSATITGGGTAKQVPITMTVTSGSAAPASSFNISPASLTYTGTVGGPNQMLGVTITNTGTSTMTVTWSDPINWFVATSGDTVTMAPGGSATISHTASTAGLAAGTYSGSATITGGGTTKQVPITMTVTPGSATPAIGLSSTSLAFSGTAGAANPAAQMIGVSNTGSGTLTWAASDNAAWLTLTPASGTNAGTIAASVNTAGLAAGTYNTTVSIAATGTATKTLPVTLTVTSASSTSGVTITPSPIVFTGAVGPGPLTIPVTFTNVGAAPVSFTWTDSISWIKAGHPAGTLSPGQSVTYNMTAVISGMAAGSYSGIGSATAGGVTKQVSITLTLSSGSATPAIGLNTTSLGFAGTVGGANPSAQTIAVSNGGSGTLSWTASDNAAWLTLSPVSGTNSGSVSANVNLTGLAAGTYNAIVTVAASGVTPRNLPVTLIITATTAGAAIGFSPTSLTFTGTVGGTNPAAKPINISNTGGGTLSWVASDNAAWLTLSPASGSNSGTLTASVNMTGLAAGTYSGIITVTASGSTNTPQQIPVSFTLSATTAGTATLAWNAGTDSDLAGYKVYRGTASGTYGAPLTTLPKTTTNYTATGLQNGTTYFFVITAYDSAGNESTYSNEVSKSIF